MGVSGEREALTGGFCNSSFRFPSTGEVVPAGGESISGSATVAERGMSFRVNSLFGGVMEGIVLPAWISSGFNAGIALVGAFPGAHITNVGTCIGSAVL